MFLLDTNVDSELRKVASKRGVLLIERRDAALGKVLRRWLINHALVNYAGRIIPLDVGTAQRCATLHVPEPKPDYDAMIAATALEHGLTIVTRNTEDFEETGVKLLNPWL